MTDVEEEIKSAQEKSIPRGSTVPHPPDWKGKFMDKRTVVPGMSVIVVPKKMKITTKTGRTRRMKPTEKQIKALSYRLQGYTSRQALLRAGYSLKYAAQPGRTFRSPVLKNLLASMQEEFQRQGITQTFIAAKFKEWFDAKDRHKEPNYEVQLKAFDRFKSVIDQENDQKSQITRRITLEEFISGQTVSDKKPDDL